MRILVVEDEPALGDAVVETLRDESYAVDWAREGGEADELFQVNPYDLVVLDWRIPGPNGLELLARWRDEGSAVPVLMLTGRQSVDDRVSGLDSGADDYLTKPFAFEELLARVRSLLRRGERPVAPLVADDVELDRSSRRVSVAGEEVRLTPKEFGVLEFLLTRLDQVVSRTEITEHVWDDDFDAMSNSLDVIVSRVRRKIDGPFETKLLETVPGVGYRLRSHREPG